MYVAYLCHVYNIKYYLHDHRFLYLKKKKIVYFLCFNIYIKHINAYTLESKRYLSSFKRCPDFTLVHEQCVYLEK